MKMFARALDPDTRAKLVRYLRYSIPVVMVAVVLAHFTRLWLADPGPAARGAESAEQEKQSPASGPGRSAERKSAGKKAASAERATARKTSSSKAARKVYVGKASYYDSSFSGKKTASGERYDPNSRTAAHRSLPLGTTVRVTNTRNGRITTVRINDRGPYVPWRVIDLSRRAARDLRIENKGIEQVRVEPVGKQRTRDENA